MSKAVFTLTLLALSACAARKDPYVVGAAGPWKQGYGLQNLQGVQLAAEEINKAGGINGHAFQVIERDESLRLRERARRQCFLDLHPEVAGWCANGTERLTRRFASRNHQLWIARDCHANAHVNLSGEHVQLHRAPAVVADLIGPDRIQSGGWRAEDGMSALIAEIPRQTHPVFVDKRDVRANNGFAIGELDDFNEDVLSGKLAADYNGRGCYEDVAQMHGSRGASIWWAARSC